jgi:uncharacterized protein YprB with RNaseH-like and TPR domain
MKKLVVDIEDIPCDDPYTALSPFIKNLHGKSSKAKPGSGLKGLVDAGSKADEVIEKAALSPVASRILCIGMYLEVEDENPLFGESGFTLIYDKDEKKMLEEFANAIRNVPTLITFNGRSFDFPFLMFRAAVHRIPLSLDIYPYNGKTGHIDMFVHLNSVGMLGNLDSSLRMVGLKKWLEYFGIGTKLSIADGELNLQEMDKAGNTEGILNYTKNDVMKTYELYKIFEGNFR